MKVLATVTMFVVLACGVVFLAKTVTDHRAAQQQAHQEELESREHSKKYMQDLEAYMTCVQAHGTDACIHP
ncbi:hypothetical protein [Kineococcus rhizosphaerae]|uniref:Uncharacterized protein n=1 Tax=Kineococcus rhizosphaerae TaxID=559628 RepID=A0A2T0QTM9_9ACTN|nr:hypothetical protein [Kineococcus rhizosphaerae]PRY08424.1 hypothetical protein CLV37_12419 [Kineococcus rhizosphaerae]